MASLVTLQAMGKGKMITVSNGGDGEEIYFAQTARDIAGTYRTQEILSPADFARFRAATETARVRVTDEVLIVNGVVRDARNTPSLNLIEFRRGLRQKLATLGQFRRLVIHEYLGVAGIDDADYGLSLRIEGSSLAFDGAQAKVIARHIGVDKETYIACSVDMLDIANVFSCYLHSADGMSTIEDLNERGEFWGILSREISTGCNLNCSLEVEAMTCRYLKRGLPDSLVCLGYTGGSF